MLAEKDFDEFFPEGSGATGDKDGVHFSGLFSLGFAIGEAC
jgi:hypothetical protein